MGRADRDPRVGASLCGILDEQIRRSGIRHGHVAIILLGHRRRFATSGSTGGKRSRLELGGAQVLTPFFTILLLAVMVGGSIISPGGRRDQRQAAPFGAYASAWSADRSMAASILDLPLRVNSGGVSPPICQSVAGFPPHHCVVLERIRVHQNRCPGG